MSEYKSLNTIAYDHLKEMIYSGELQFNKIYSETKLAAQLSISRTPIRDALNRLSQERYIDILPNRGFTLHKPTDADIIEAYHVRMMIEGYCGAIVARHYPRDAKARATISRMEDALERQQALMDREADYSLSQFWLDDLDFHKAPLEYMNISALNLQYESFMHMFMPHHLLGDDDPDRVNEKALARHRSTLVEHQEIIEAFKSRDVDRVHLAIRAHLDSGLKVSSVSLLD